MRDYRPGKRAYPCSEPSSRWTSKALYLTSVNLEGANLTHANLEGANLTHTNLASADLTGANLARADLTRANLASADLTVADLTRASLFFVTGADFTGARFPPDEMVPWGWRRDADSGRLKRAD